MWPVSGQEWYNNGAEWRKSGARVAQERRKSGTRVAQEWRRSGSWRFGFVVTMGQGQMIPARGPQTGFLDGFESQAKPAKCTCGLGKSRQVGGDGKS